MAQALQRDVAIGVFHHRDKAEAAISDLRAAGFAAADIGVAAKNEGGAWDDYAQTPQSTATAEPVGTDGDRAAAGAAVGAAAGAGVGGLWAMGIAAGMLPAIGPVIAGGLLASILASAATGAVAGGFLGALVSLGVPKEEAELYEREFASGRTIVTVRARGRMTEATRILQAHGAFDVNRSESTTVAV